MCAQELKRRFEDDSYEMPLGDGHSSQVTMGANALASVPTGTTVFLSQT